MYTDVTTINGETVARCTVGEAFRKRGRVLENGSSLSDDRPACSSDRSSALWTGFTLGNMMGLLIAFVLWKLLPLSLALFNSSLLNSSPAPLNQFSREYSALSSEIRSDDIWTQRSAFEKLEELGEAGKALESDVTEAFYAASVPENRNLAQKVLKSFHKGESEEKFRTSLVNGRYVRLGRILQSVTADPAKSLDRHTIQIVVGAINPGYDQRISLNTSALALRIIRSSLAGGCTATEKAELFDEAFPAMVEARLLLRSEQDVREEALLLVRSSAEMAIDSICAQLNDGADNRDELFCYLQELGPAAGTDRVIRILGACLEGSDRWKVLPAIASIGKPAASLAPRIESLMCELSATVANSGDLASASDGDVEEQAEKEAGLLEIQKQRINQLQEVLAALNVSGV